MLSASPWSRFVGVRRHEVVIADRHVLRKTTQRDGEEKAAFAVNRSVPTRTKRWIHATMPAKIAMLHIARVIMDTPNTRIHSAFMYGESGPNSEAMSRIKLCPALSATAYSSRPKSTRGSGHFRQLQKARHDEETTAWTMKAVAPGESAHRRSLTVGGRSDSKVKCTS